MDVLAPDVASVVPLFVSRRMAWMCWPMRGRPDVVSACAIVCFLCMDVLANARASGCSLCIVCFL